MGACGHQSIERDQLEKCDLVRERQRLAYEPVREHHTIAWSRISRADEGLNDVFTRG